MSVAKANDFLLKTDWSTKINRFTKIHSRKVRGAPHYALYYKVSEQSSILCLFRDNKFIAGYHTGNFIYSIKTTQIDEPTMSKKLKIKCPIYSNLPLNDYKIIDTTLMNAFNHVKNL